jgi:CheY-like chemotaxis protein
MSGSTTLGIDLFDGRRAWRRSRIHGRRILYVDDEPLMRGAVARVLRGAGAVSLGAGSHDQAIALLELEFPLDLAILDFQMPEGDPASLLRRLRRRWPALPVVGTSGLDRRSEFAAQGVERFLRKPWTLDDLIRVADWSEARGDLLPAARR